MKKNKIRLVARYLRRRVSRIHPVEVQACITNQCNMKCRYCACPTLPPDDLPEEAWLTIIRGLGRYGLARLKFQGGEPTQRPDFGRLTAEAKSLGLITAVATNGTFIKDKPALLDDVDEVIVTLNSLRRDVQDDLRGEGSYDAVLRTMEIAQARGVKVFNNMVVNTRNFGELEAVFDFCERRGVVFHAQPVVFGRVFFDSSAKDLQLSHEETRSLNLRLAEWKRRGRRVLVLPSSYERSARWHDYNDLNLPGEAWSSCFAGRDYVHIEPNGDVFPCNLHIGFFRPKNAARDGLGPALLPARRHRCKDCWHPYFNERKSMFGLRWEAVRSVFRA
jgi:MoaA/NifB/PqqE/SkfB family radical SAM enzyme